MRSASGSGSGAASGRASRASAVWLRRLDDLLIGVGGMWAASMIAAPLHPNSMIMGMAFLVMVLGIATWRGLLAGTIASVSGVALLNYYFVAPVGWNIQEPEDVVALFSFLFASTVSSRLVVLARTRAAESEARSREVRVLYDLSVELFGTSGRESIGPALGRAFSRLGARGGRVFVAEPEAFCAAFGALPPAEGDPGISRALASGVRHASVDPGGVDLDIPLVVDGRMAGVLAVRGTWAGREAVDSASRLVALALERERLLRERLHLEALRESDALKTSLLRAVSHDLRTPLTAIRLKIETLRRLLPAMPLAAEALTTMTLEVENLKHRIDNLLSMARLQAGMSVPRPEPSPPADLFRAAREGLSSILEGRSVHVAVDEECPDVFVDPSLAVEILINLLENAAHAAPPEAPIELRAVPEGSAVRLAVLDRGPGVPKPIAEVVRGASTPETTGAVRRGLGVEIARGLAESSGGAVEFEPRPGGGTIASVVLPAFQPRQETFVRTA